MRPIKCRFCINRANRRSALFTLILVGLALAGCERGPTTLPEEEAAPSETVERAAPQRLLFDLYIDASFSMRGFSAGSQALNRDYNSLVGTVAAIAKKNHGNLVHQYRWGTNSATGELAEISDTARVMDPNFYGSKEDKRAAIAELVEPGSSATRFTVIATDLLFDRQDASDFVKRLVRGIRQQNRGFGIFSCQLPFDGQIDRLTPEIRDVAYHGKRRLYLLFFGHRAVVEQFARALKTELQQQLIDADALILSPRIINRPFDFENGHVDRLVGVARLNPTFTRNNTKLLAIQPFSDAIDESIQLSFPLDRPEDSVVLTPPAIEVAPSAFIWRSNGWAEVPLGKMNLKDEIKIEQVNRDRIQQRLIFNMGITAPTFSQRGWYYLDLSFRSKIRDLTLPDWVADADLPRSKSFENGWDPSAFKGRTPGLREYIESIQGAISDESEEIGNLRILLERN